MLLTLRETAQAVKKSERGLRKDLAAGRFGPEVLKLGRSVRIRADELADWIRAGCPNRESWLEQRVGDNKTAAR